MRASATALVCAAAFLAAMAVTAAPWIDVSKPLDADNAAAGASGAPPRAPDARAIAEEAAAGDHVAGDAMDAAPAARTEVPPAPAMPTAPSASPAAAQRDADLARPVAQATLVETAAAPVTARKSPQMMAVPGSRATLADAIDDSEDFSVDNGGAGPAGGAGTATDMPATAPAPATGSTSRAPVAYVLPGPRYQVQPGDILQITVWKEEDLQREVLVRPDGGISFPLAGDVQAAGRTVDQVQEELAAKIESYIPEPVVTVAVKQVVGNRVYVVGRVNKPGEIIMGHELTVMQALSLAGGVTPFAALNRVHVLRRENGVERSIPFRYGDVEKGRGLSQNIVLQNGDVVVVP
jgi:polysaccharide export outer membrane protein